MNSWRMRRQILYPLTAIIIALALRLYPTIISGTPFSTDAWSPIRNSELLIEHTPISLDDKLFDGYHNYWPANSLFGAVTHLMTSLSPKDSMAALIPVAGAMTILIIYVITRRLFNPELAFIASMIFATTYTHAIFTAGANKETYANPLYAIILLIFLRQAKTKRPDTLLFAITSAALVLSHHITSYIIAAFLISIAIALTVDRRGFNLDGSKILQITILTGMALSYYQLYARIAFPMVFDTSELLSAASYQVVALTLALYLTKRDQKSTRPGGILMSSFAVLLTLLFIVAIKKPLIPGAPVLPAHYVLYAAPLILTALLIGPGYMETASKSSAQHSIIFWLASILGFELWAVFGNPPMGLTLAFRGINFLWPPLAILSAAGLHRLSRAGGGVAKPFMLVILLAIAALNSYGVYAAVNNEERYLGYFWLYKPTEYEAGSWMKTNSINQTISGDMKAHYLLNGYYEIDVDVIEGYSYLIGISRNEPQILYTYDQMLKNGYVIAAGNTLDLPEKWTNTASQLNLLYSNRAVKIYGGG